MPLPFLPKVNGQSYQHATLAPVILSDGGRLPLKAFKSLTFGDETKKKPVFDAQGQRTGQWTLDKQDDGAAACEILQTEWFAIQKFLSTAYPLIGIGQIVMDWNVSFGNTLATLITYQLHGVMFQNDKFDSSENQDALYNKVDLIVTGQIISGVTGKPFIVYDPPTAQ